MTQPAQTPPQTVVVSRRVRKGEEDAFERLSTQMTEAASSFPGHLGAVMFRPSSPDDPEYRIIFKFDTQDHLDDWLNSSVRRDFTTQIEDLLETPSKYETLTSLATWFTLPRGAGVPVKPPPRHKMAFVSWLALYPIVTLIFWIFGPWLAQIPLVLRTAMVTIAVILLLTYVAMPRMTRLFKGWLYPQSGETRR